MDGPSLDATPPLSAAPAALSAYGAYDLRDWRHSLVVLEGQDVGRRIELDDKPLVLGRRSAADLVLPEMLVSGLHCRIQIQPGRPALKVTDFKSTNGTFINGQRVDGSAYLAPGSVLAVGQHIFRHEFLSPEKHIQAVYGDVQRYHTVAAWMPHPLHKGPVRADWCYRPGKPPQGAGLALLPLPDARLALVLIDVCGAGPQAARHAAGILRELREVRDVAGAAALLAQLNRRWPMAEHDGLFFTAWVAVADPRAKRLTHACAGQHPALLRQPDGELQRLDALGPPVGLLPDAEFAEESLDWTPGSRLFVFNKGAFEGGRGPHGPWAFDDFEAMLACQQSAKHSGPDTAYAELVKLTDRSAAGDDFLLLQVELHS